MVSRIQILASAIVYCQAKTKRGARCHNPVAPGSDYCHVHAPLHNGEADGAAQKQQQAAAIELHNPPRSSARTRVSQLETNPLLNTLANLLNNSAIKGNRSTRATPTKTRPVAATAPANKSNGEAGHSSDDPFEALAAAVSAAAAAAEKAPPKPEPKAGKRRGAPDDPLGKALYTAAYGVGYGVALPTFLLLGMLPDNALGRGLRDGAKAAKETVERRRKR